MGQKEGNRRNCFGLPLINAGFSLVGNNAKCEKQICFFGYLCLALPVLFGTRNVCMSAFRKLYFLLQQFCQHKQLNINIQGVNLKTSNIYYKELYQIYLNSANGNVNISLGDLRRTIFKLGWWVRAT